MVLFIGTVGLLLMLLSLILALVNVVTRLRKRRPSRWVRWPFLLGALVVGFVLTYNAGKALPPEVVAKKPANETTTPSREVPETAVTQPAREAETPSSAASSEDSARQTPDPTPAPEATGTPIDVAAFVLQCQEAVTSQLKSPSTARFAGTMTKLGQVRELEDNGKMWAGYVEAQNGFGATVRSDFICAYSSKTGQVSATVQD